MGALDERAGVAAIVAVLSAACAAPPPSTPVTAAPIAATAPAAAPTFVNRVWQVAESSSVAPGQLYVFLSEGTLVVASSTGTPSLGRWEQAGDGLVMVEEGQRYSTDIVSLTASELRLRSHNPGTPVDIRLVPAPSPALGGAR